MPTWDNGKGKIIIEETKTKHHFKPEAKTTL
jgi:hypothetical protein